jgi:hypothetical protein
MPDVYAMLSGSLFAVVMAGIGHGCEQVREECSILSSYPGVFGMRDCGVVLVPVQPGTGTSTKTADQAGACVLLGLLGGDRFSDCGRAVRGEFVGEVGGRCGG